jgi:hypothetical protein
VLAYLIKLGIEPKAMAAYLAKPGQGINAIYKKAMARKKAIVRKKRPTKKAQTSAKRSEHKPIKRALRSPDHAARGDAAHVAAVENDTSGMRKTILQGNDEIMSRLFEVPDGRVRTLRVKWLRDASGRRFVCPVELLESSQTKSERRKRVRMSASLARPAFKRLRREHRRSIR